MRKCIYEVSVMSVNAMTKRKSFTVDYDLWAKVTNLKTLLAEKESNISNGDIIERGFSLYLAQCKKDGLI